MRTFSRVCFASAVVCSLTFATTPVANALPREGSSPAVRAESSWLGATLDWLQSLLDRSERSQGWQEGKPAPTVSQEKKASNGSCIDPLGRPRPCTR
jgi:hypothetical protein